MLIVIEFALGKDKMRKVLTVIDYRELPAGWESDFPFDALSIKPTMTLMQNGKRVWVDQIGPVQKLLPQGKQLYLWEWAGFSTPQEAAEFGKQMGQLCTAHAIPRFYLDGEAEMYGSGKYERVDNPYHNLIEFLTAFYAWAPEDIELVWNGFSWDRNEHGQKVYDDALLKIAFDLNCIMCYGVKREDILTTTRDKFKKRRNGPPISPMFGVGRIDKDGDTWGFWDVHKQLLDELQPPEVHWFFGNGCKSQYKIGHKDHPALVQCAREIA